MMKESIILVSVKQNAGNPYIDELYKIISQRFKVIFNSANFWRNENYNIIHIHWPEELFQYKNVNKNDLRKFMQRLNYWKVKQTKIVYTYHNLKSHNCKGYDQIHSHLLKVADAVVHLGKYSLKLNRRSLNINYLIPHHIYTSYPNINKSNARKTLGLKTESDVLLIPGTIRNNRELKFINKILRNINSQNFILIVQKAPKTFNYEWVKKPYTSLLRNIYITILKRKKNCLLNTAFLTNKDLANYYSASDLVLIPRLNGELNSGTVFLSIFYKLKVVGPEIGNINEVLKSTGNYTFSNFNQAINHINTFFLNKRSCDYTIVKEEWSLFESAKKHIELFNCLLA